MKYIYSILFIGLFANTYSQNSITGSITNHLNSPIYGAQIYIEELHIGTSSNEKGYYEIHNLPNSTLKLEVSFLGYESKTISIPISKKETTLNIVLMDAIFHMDEVIISTHFNKLQSENVVKVDRISAQQLSQNGATSLVDGITSMPGVSQVSTGSGIGKPVIRGLRGNRVLVYSQGIRLENQQFGDEHGLGIDEASIESVEVIKGPASLLYGSDALGGVLYFVPTKFAESNKLDINFKQQYIANTLGSNTSLGVKKTFNHWKFLANGTYNTHSDYETPNQQRITNTRYNESIFNSAINFNNKLISSTLRYNFNHSNLGIPEEFDIQSRNKEPLLPKQDLTTNMLSLNTLFFLKNSKINTTLGYTLNDRKEFEEHHHDELHEAEELEEDHPSLHLDLNTFSYDLKWHLPTVGKIETILGVQGLHQKNKNFGEEILIPDATTTDFGTFFTGLYSWNENTIQAGVRFDTRQLTTKEHVVTHEDEVHVFEAIDKSFENISASLGYKTVLFKQITSRLNVASGFKAPNLSELTSNGIHHGSNRFEIGNNNLKSERNLQSDISFEYDTDHFEVFANGFYNHINNYIFIAPTGEFEEDTEIYEYTQENARLYGGEFGWHLHPHPLDWLHLNSSFEIVIGKQKNGNYLPLIPANKLKNTLKSEINSKWIKNAFALITLENNFSQKNVSQFETTTKGYNLVHIGFGGSTTIAKSTISFNFNINNVFNTSYISHLSRLKYDNIENMGRNLMLTVGLNF